MRSSLTPTPKPQSDLFRTFFAVWLLLWGVILWLLSAEARQYGDQFNPITQGVWAVVGTSTVLLWVAGRSRIRRARDEFERKSLMLDSVGLPALDHRALANALHQAGSSTLRVALGRALRSLSPAPGSRGPWLCMGCGRIETRSKPDLDADPMRRADPQIESHACAHCHAHGFVDLATEEVRRFAVGLARLGRGVDGIALGVAIAWGVSAQVFLDSTWSLGVAAAIALFVLRRGRLHRGVPWTVPAIERAVGDRS